MIKKIVICDRCGKECTNGEYYTIDFELHNVDPNVGYLDVRDADEEHYCEKCRDEISAFIFKKGIKYGKIKHKEENKCENCKYAIDCINGLLETCIVE